MNRSTKIARYLRMLLQRLTNCIQHTSQRHLQQMLMQVVKSVEECDCYNS